MKQEAKLKLNQSDERKREFILNGNLWSSVIHICLPLAVFQLINQLFKVIDLVITANIGSKAVAAVSFLSQINNTFSAIGGGLAIGVSIIIAGYYGEGDYAKVKKAINSVFAWSAIFSVGLAMVLIVFAKGILRMVNTPDDLIAIGTNYYICEVVGLVLVFMNGIYMSVEKARGNSGYILRINFIFAAIKIVLSWIFVFLFHYGITMISVATILANLTVTIIGIYRLKNKEDVFGLSKEYVSLRWDDLKSMVVISLPIIAEKVAFSAGKVMVNSMGADYGSEVVGALGVSNNISALSTVPPTSVGEAGSAIIRQNLANNKKQRALVAFRNILILNMIIGVVGFVLTMVNLDPIIGFFANGDADFAVQVKQIFLYEQISNIFLSVNASVMALLYGFGYTKLTFFINFSRLFLFRIPLLYLLQKMSSFGGEALGIVMMVSNGLTGITAIIIAVIVIYFQYGKAGFQFSQQVAEQK